MDTGIHLLNNRGQKVTGSTPIGSTRIFSSKPPLSMTEKTSSLSAISEFQTLNAIQTLSTR